MNTQCKLAQSIAPEDLRPGCYVMILKKVDEWIHWPECISGERWKGELPRVVNVLLTPDEEPVLMKVELVCLPLLLVRTSKAQHKLLDARKVRLASVDVEFARKAFKRLPSSTSSE